MIILHQESNPRPVDNPQKNLLKLQIYVFISVLLTKMLFTEEALENPLPKGVERL